MKRLILILPLCLFNYLKAQILTLDELISFPTIGMDKVEQQLKQKGWDNYNAEFVTDSNLVKKTWVIDNKYNTLKSYVQFFDFTEKNEESYCTYQFSDRPSYEGFKSNLKKLGYKEVGQKKKKKKRKEDKNIYKERDDVYLSEKTGSMIVLKEVFVYGMNSFLFVSYKSNSRISKDILQQLEK